MKNLRFSMVFSIIVASAALSVGCSRTPDASPNSIQSGSLDEVARISEGAGGRGGRDPVLDMGIMPVDGFPAPKIHTIRDTESIPIWFYPSLSPDGRSLREGFWAHHVIRQAEWVFESAERTDRFKIDQLGEYHVDELGRLIRVPRKPNYVAGDEAGKLLPYTADGNETRGGQ